MRFKPGVRLHGISPQIAIGLQVADSILVNAPFNERHGCHVTSINDGNHGPKSKHKTGNAFDLRLPSRLRAGGNWGQEIESIDIQFARKLRVALGDRDWDVILEQHQADPFQWHIHCEWDPI